METATSGKTGLLTIKEAAAIVGRSPRTVRRWIETGELPDLVVEIAGRIYIRQCVLERIALGD